MRGRWFHVRCAIYQRERGRRPDGRGRRAPAATSGPRAGGLRLASRRSDGEWTIAVSGELDISSAPRLLDAYAEAEASHADRVVVDLTGLEFMDSAGLRAVLGLDARSGRNGTQLALRRGRDDVHRVFVLTRTAERLPFL